jgi:hypothetical protein
VANILGSGAENFAMEEQTCMMKGGQGRPSLMTDDLVQHVDKMVRERRRFTVSELSPEFIKVCRTVLYEFVTKILATTSFVPDGCQKCSLMFTKHKEWRQV